MWHCGHSLSVGTAALWVERRFVVRECDCFCLGTAMRAQEDSVPAGTSGSPPRSKETMARTHPTEKWIRARKDERTVVDSRRAVCVWRDRPYPFYAFPESDVEGVATTPVAELPGHVAVEWNAVDEWLADDEPLVGHARDPFARIDVVRSSRHVVVEHAGVVLADSRGPLLLYETGLRTRTYLPPEDVRTDLLGVSDTRTACAYKGHAEHLAHDGTDVAWRYPEPLFDAPPIRGLIAFYDERVDVRVTPA